MNSAFNMSEVREFATFTPGAQRYIRRSLDIALERVENAATVWGRDEIEITHIRVQIRFYATLPELRMAIPEKSDLSEIPHFFGSLVKVSAFDIGSGKIDSFNCYRFLYERLLGAGSRPWLPAEFCAAASLPNLQPEMRKHLLQTITEAAATALSWSSKEPTFFPEWVEKIEIPI